MVRASSRQRGYDTRWDKARKAYLNKHPLCVLCKASGRVSQANVVDHIVPHKGDKALFWDQTNWQALCPTCHSSHKQSIEVRGYDKTIGVDGWPTDPNHPANRGSGGV